MHDAHGWTGANYFSFCIYKFTKTDNTSILKDEI
jgi:hypothetical protein